jgi:hypothetical protein
MMTKTKAGLAALLGVFAAASLAAPPAHVMEHGERADPGAAYLVVVPHFRVFGEKAEVVACVISGRTADGDARDYAIRVAADKPAVLRVAPGRYHVSEVDISTYHWSFGETDSMFEAKAGQLNYPGDWNFSLDNHNINFAARTVGWRVDAALYTDERPIDAKALDLDADFGIAPAPVYTRIDPPPPHPNGSGDR